MIHVFIPADCHVIDGAFGSALLSSQRLSASVLSAGLLHAWHVATALFSMLTGGPHV
jgi:hypothetical protein